MSEEIKSKSKEEQPASPEPSQKVPISWVFLGIGAVIIMWALSSWLFR